MKKGHAFPYSAGKPEREEAGPGINSAAAGIITHLGRSIRSRKAATEAAKTGPSSENQLNMPNLGATVTTLR